MSAAPSGVEVAAIAAVAIYAIKSGYETLARRNGRGGQTVGEHGERLAKLETTLEVVQPEHRQDGRAIKRLGLEQKATRHPGHPRTTGTSRSAAGYRVWISPAD